MSAPARARAIVGHAAAVVAIAVIGCVVFAMVGLAAGHRPVVLESGSMGDAAPAGSLLVASPRPPERIGIGDIVVMRRPGQRPVTHRVVSVEQTDVGRVATTRGDANDADDPTPYVLGDDELVARWVVPSAGRAVSWVSGPRGVVALLGLAATIVSVGALRRIWARTPSGGRPTPPAGSPPAPGGSLPPPPPPPPVPGAPPAPAAPRATVGRVAVGLGIVLGLTFCGIVFSLFSSVAAIDANDFGTSDCFAPKVASVQHGTTVTTADGPIVEALAAVEPTRSFVVASVRSPSGRLADASARVRLVDATTLEIRRATDDASPPAVTVEWSVVEYACGLRVQRGVANGDGATNRVDVAIDAVDVGSSTVLVGTLAPPGAVAVAPSGLTTAHLTAPGTLTIEASAAAVLETDRSFAWQVVSFDDPDLADVVSPTATLPAGATSTTITLAEPVDRASTFLVASLTSDATGPAVGDRVIRARLVDDTTVVVDRGVGGDEARVRVQVATWHDGTHVVHGTVDLDAAATTTDVSIEGVDPGRSTVSSTVAVPGPLAGGLTTHVPDQALGEASATFELVDATTVRVTRDAAASPASFALQAVEWSGPPWWDADYDFRRRVDVRASSTAAPGGYTVPLELDHAALVAQGISRPDGADVRVLRWDGVTWTELDRVLDDGSSWGTATTTVLFRTVDPIGVAGTSSYWLYLDDPAAPAAPADPERVYLLSEGFETGDLGDFEDRTGGTGWYEADPWSRRIAVTVPAAGVAADLVDFPLLVSLTDPDVAASANADGSDLRFTAADGTTPLDHELESYDPATGAVVAWVHVPLVSATADTTIHLVYGAPDAPDQQDVRAAWPADVEAAWHLSRDPAGDAPQLDDSTAANHDGLTFGAMSSADLVEGLVGPALDLDGADDGVRADALDLDGFDELTASAWLRLDALTTDGHVVGVASGEADRQFDLVVTSTGAVRARLLLDGGERAATTAAGAVPTGSWHHVAATWDGADLRVVVDGAVAASTPAAGRVEPRPQLPTTLGILPTGARPLDGLLDEVRIERAARPVAWLDAAVRGQRDPSTFLVIGAPEADTAFDQGTWTRRLPLAVDAGRVDADVVGEPLLVQLVEPGLAAAAQADADDLVFTGADGTSRLDHVVEAFDPGTGALTAWVSVPVLDGDQDTRLFAYYGNPTATDQSDPAAVFGSDADLQLPGAP